MKYFCLTLFSIISLYSINSKLSGTFSSDWQNGYFQRCVPQSLKVTSVNDTYSTVSYKFAPANLAHCPALLNLTEDSSTGSFINTVGPVWVDNFGFKLMQNDGTLSYNFGGPSEPYYLYNSNQDVFPQQDSLGSIEGSWMNPVPVPGVNASACCAPDSIYLSLYGLPAQINALYSYNSTSPCAGVNTMNYHYSILAPMTQSLVWSGTGDGTPNTITFNPNTNFTNFTLTLNPTCVFYFQKAPIRNPLSNTWKRDWQSGSPPKGINIKTYQISIVNNSKTAYMTSKITSFNDSVYNAFVVQNPQGDFYDTLTGNTYSFDTPTNTLLDVTNKQFFSPNGSLLTSDPFLGTWHTPAALTNRSLPIGCCVPTYITISKNGTRQSPLDVVYQLPTNYAEIEGCLDLITDIDNRTAQISSSLTVKSPSITQLLWTDPVGANISLIDNSHIAVQGLPDCGFSMVLNESSKPKPLTSSLVSIGVLSSLVGLLIMLVL